jgi:hypothetical protein
MAKKKVIAILDRDHVDRKLLYLHSFGLLDFFKSFASSKNKSYAHIYDTYVQKALRVCYQKVLIGEVVRHPLSLDIHLTAKKKVNPILDRDHVDRKTLPA